MTVLKSMLFAVTVTAAVTVHAQGLPTAGTLVVVPASGEVVHANDQVIITLAIEEQDKDKAAAASRVNQKMNQGVAIVKKSDPQAVLKTQGYYTYAVYPEAEPVPAGGVTKPRVPTSWRVGQTLQVKTMNLSALPKTVSAAQAVMTLNRLNFSLSPETVRKLDNERIVAAYKNLNERVAAIAGAMGRNVSDAVIDTLDFEGTGGYVQGNYAPPAPPAPLRAMKNEATQVAEPNFEPGETAVNLRVVAKVKFK